MHISGLSRSTDQRRVFSGRHGCPRISAKTSCRKMRNPQKSGSCSRVSICCRGPRPSKMSSCRCCYGSGPFQAHHIRTAPAHSGSPDRGRIGGSRRASSQSAFRRAAAARRHCAGADEQSVRLSWRMQPTARNLDSRTSVEVMDIFPETLREERGITIVLITHEQQVAEYGSRIVTFKDHCGAGGSFPISANRRQRIARGRTGGDAGKRGGLMNSIRPSVLIALRALSRNKLQTALTMVGITIGVATVLTMIALGSGAQTAIEDQVRAAGLEHHPGHGGQLQDFPEDGRSGRRGRRAGAVLKDSGAVHVPARCGILSRRSQLRSGLSFILKTIPWKSTTILPPASGSAILRPELGAAATLTGVPMPMPSAKSSGVQYVSEGIHQQRACASQAPGVGSRGCTETMFRSP